MLEAYDQTFLAGCFLDLEATFPTTAFDRGQGLSTFHVQITSNGGEQAMVLQHVQAERNVYSTNHVTTHYDQGGNYVLAHHKQEFALLGSASWKMRTDMERRTIDPAGKVVNAEARKPILEIRPVGNPDAANLLYRYVLPLGRGFSQLLSSVTTVIVDEKSIAYVEARGTLFSANEGTWLLEIDTARDYLVRSAVFTVDGDSISSEVQPMEGGGVLGKDVPVYRQGSFALMPDYVISVSLKSYNQGASDAVLNVVRTAVGAVGEKWTLMDFTRTNENGSPFALRSAAIP